MKNEFSYKFFQLLGDEQKTFEEIIHFIQESIGCGSYKLDLIYGVIVKFSCIDDRIEFLEYIYDDAKKILPLSTFEQALKQSIVNNMEKSSFFFLDKGIQIDTNDISIRNSISSLNLELIKKIHENGYPINGFDGYILFNCLGVSPPRFDVVDYMENCGTNIEKNHELWMYAGSMYEDDFKNKIDYLLSKGLSIHCENSELTKQALHNEFPNILEYIISLGVDLQLDPQSLLLECKRNSGIEMIKILIKNGVSLDPANDELMQATAERGNVKMVKFLLNQGLNRDIAQQYGTPEIKELCAENFYQEMNSELADKAVSEKKLKI